MMSFLTEQTDIFIIHPSVFYPSQLVLGGGRLRAYFYLSRHQSKTRVHAGQVSPVVLFVHFCGEFELFVS